MRAARAARLAHRWLALIVGLQLVVWAASGLYMTSVDLDLIHGDPLVRNLQTPVAMDRVHVTPAEVLGGSPGAVTGVTLRALPTGGPPVYELRHARGMTLIDAESGRPLPPLTAEAVTALARAYYAGDGELARVQLLERDLPQEVQGRMPPLWRADFDDWLATSLYVDPVTGRLVTRRHRLWRWFDLLWSLHIMDYRERTDVNNTLLRTVTLGGLLLAASGLWLIAYAFPWRRKRPGTRAAATMTTTATDPAPDPR